MLSWVYVFLVFNLSKMTTQKVGMGITSVAMKLGVVFPVLIGILFYSEDFQWINYVGLLLGLSSIYFINKSSKDVDYKQDKLIFILPLLVWFGSGLCDSAVQLIQKSFPIPASNGTFSFTAFLSAATSSIAFVLFKRMKWDIKSLIGVSLWVFQTIFPFIFWSKRCKKCKKSFIWRVRVYLWSIICLL